MADPHLLEGREDVGRIVLSFSGSDTLCLARFVHDLLSMKDVLRHCLLYIQGRHTRTGRPTMFLAAPTACKIDGYVRCLYVRVLHDVADTLPEHIVGSGRDIDIGCINATAEEVAASRITFVFFSLHHDINLKIANVCFRYYIEEGAVGAERLGASQPSSHVRCIDFQHTDFRHYREIAQARDVGHLTGPGGPRAPKEIFRELRSHARRLTDYLTNERIGGIDDEIRAIAADSFRAFEKACLQYKALSVSMTKGLLRFIEKSQCRGSWPDAVIYALESLGFVANNQTDPGNSASNALCRILCDPSQRRAHRHVLWASLVALDRMQGKELDSSRIEALQRQPFDDIPAAVFESLRDRLVKHCATVTRMNRATRSGRDFSWMLPREMIVSICKSPIVVFLGAGASVSSHIPSAQECIWRWKLEIYRGDHKAEWEHQPEVLADPTVQEAITKWLRTHLREWLDENQRGEFRKLEPADEYAFYAKHRRRDSESVREFFGKAVAKAAPAVGYSLLGLLAKQGMIDSVWTTNFDSLTARSMPDGMSVYEVGLDTWRRLPQEEEALADHELLHVSLHGDFRYDNLRTGSEEEEFQKQLLNALGDRIRNRDLIAIGYSGRDRRTIMRFLGNAYSKKEDSGRLFWCGLEREAPIPDAVISLLRHAKRKGRKAYHVPCPDFDALLTHLAWTLLPHDILQTVL